MTFPIKEILGRLKEAKKVRTDKDLAKLMGIERTALVQGKKRESAALILKIIEFAKSEDLSLDWILTGEQKHVGFAAGEPPDVLPFLELAEKVLMSDYALAREALKSNIICFADAVTRAEESKDMKAEIEALKDEIRKMRPAESPNLSEGNG